MILEEFALSLAKLPSVYLLVMDGIEKVELRMLEQVYNGYNWVESRCFRNELRLQKRSYLQVILVRLTHNPRVEID